MNERDTAISTAVRTAAAAKTDEDLALVFGRALAGFGLIVAEPREDKRFSMRTAYAIKSRILDLERESLENSRLHDKAKKRGEEESREARWELDELKEDLNHIMGRN